MEAKPQVFKLGYPYELAVTPADLIADGDLERLDLEIPLYMTAYTFRDDIDMIRIAAVDLDYERVLHLGGFGDTADSTLFLIGKNREHVSYYDQRLRTKRECRPTPFSQALQMPESSFYGPEDRLCTMIDNCWAIRRPKRKDLLVAHLSFSDRLKQEARPWSIGELYPRRDPALAK